MPDSGGPALRRTLGLRDLVLFNVAAVIGIRWIAAAAHIGPGSISLWIAAMLGFFVPYAMAVASLSSRFPEEGGIYIWTRQAFGGWHGFLCGFCYWFNNLFYIPSLVLSGITMAGYIFGVDLVERRAFTIPASVAAIAIVTLVNVVGLNIAKWIGNLGGAATYTAGVFFVVAGAYAWSVHGWANNINIVPELDWEKLNFWPQIAFAFGGLELGAVLAGEIRDPARNVRRAIWIGGALVCLFYIAGTAGMLALQPANQISVVNGLTQTAAVAATLTGLPWISNVLALLITLGVAGQMSAWLGGIARLPMVLGMDHYLPASFSDLHPRWGTPVKPLVWQAVACSVFLVAMQLGESLRTGYQLLVDLAVITNFIPFAYLFATAWKYGSRVPAIAGMAVTLIAIVFSFIPPAEVASFAVFEAKLFGGTILTIVVARWWFVRQTA